MAPVGRVGVQPRVVLEVASSFIQNLDHAQPHDTIGPLATHPGLPKHKKWLKDTVLLGNQQVAAAIRAYEFTLDVEDFIESLNIIKTQLGK